MLNRIATAVLTVSAVLIGSAGAQSVVVNHEGISGNPLNLNPGGGIVKVGGTLDIGYEIVTDEHTGDGGFESEGVACPTGKKVLGGGCFAGGNSDDQLDSSHPTGDHGWNCVWQDTQDGHTLKAYAICADVR